MFQINYNVLNKFFTAKNTAVKYTPLVPELLSCHTTYTLSPSAVAI